MREQLQGKKTYLLSAALILYSLLDLFGTIPDGGIFATGKSQAIANMLGALVATTIRLAVARYMANTTDRLIRMEGKLDALMARSQDDG